MPVTSSTPATDTPARPAPCRRPVGDRPTTPACDSPSVGRIATLAYSGALALWAAFPPLDVPYLAWVAPWPWLSLAQETRLPLRRATLLVWLAGTTHWLLMLEGIRRAHPALYAGWVALAAYLGLYLPLFVLLTRQAVQRWRLPRWLAAPVAWTGLELVRGHLLTGFSMGLLAHTQVQWPRLIQIADLTGGYGLSFFVMLTSAATLPVAEKLAARWLTARAKHRGRRPDDAPAAARQPHAGDRLWPGLLVAAAGWAGCLSYGQWRLAQHPPAQDGQSLRVALIQGSLDTVFDVTQERLAQTLAHYHELTVQATRRAQPLDLVVWPESAFVFPETILDERSDAASAPSADERMRQRLVAAQANFQARLAYEVQTANAPAAGGAGPSFTPDWPVPPARSSGLAASSRGAWLAVGTTTHVWGSGGPRSYNTAVLADPTGKVRGRYAKMHLVMFGEYIPLGDRLPWLYQLTPLASGLAAGDRPAAFEVAGLRLAPSICFESTVPHLIRRQIAQLEQHGEPVDLLLNFTNDGWFWGSAMLDLHFRCGVFRAVENRKPLLIAANTGLSAVIDGNGVVRQRGPRRQPDLLIANVHADGRQAPYGWWGDLPAGLCAAACALWALPALWAAFRRRTSPADSRGQIDYSEKTGTKLPAAASNPADSGPASAPG